MVESAVDKILFLRDNGNGAKFRARDWLPYNDASRKAFCEATAEIAKIFEYSFLTTNSTPLKSG